MNGWRLFYTIGATLGGFTTISFALAGDRGWTLFMLLLTIFVTVVAIKGDGSKEIGKDEKKEIE